MSNPTQVRRFRNGEWESFADEVSREQAFEIIWLHEKAGQTGSGWLWAWPGPDRDSLKELALGYTLTELLPGSLASSILSREMEFTEDASTFMVPLLGAGTLPLLRASPPLQEPAAVLSRMTEFMAFPGRWDGTGCFHRAGMFLASGEDTSEDYTLHVAEDIGRHNCLDRLAGYAALRGQSLRGATLFVTARITASLYVKARRIGFTTLVSRSAVTAHAVREAKREGVRLIGFCRPHENRFTIFAD